ncbi:M48 family metalloprotease [Magnetospirillum sp. 15-1]|uniref:M48 family metalloprotease n=1 Tax=Magnetospirillum sp. 15-1 TaxID=1979370 RepID=UPI001482CE9B|nr:M48 family metalloprotease [Magnetospirillum sp. 15-1]
MLQAVLLAALAHAALEAWLAGRAQDWLRHHAEGRALIQESGRVRLLAARGLGLSALAALAALGGAALLAEVCGPWGALPAALVVRAAFDLPFAAWGRRLGGVWNPRSFLAEQARRLIKELAPALPLAVVAGGGWIAAWVALAALLLWREMAPPSGRILTPSHFQAPVPVWISDEGSRTGQLNARAEGIGPRRRIILNDTLVEALPADEVAAVLAHEAGHLEHRHREWFLVWRLGLAALLLVLARWAGGDITTTLTLLVLAAPVLALPVRPLEARLIRRWEEQADAHAAAQAGAEPFARALRHLYGANAQAPEPERLWAAFHHPHPPPRRRLERLRNAACASS